MHYLIKEMLLNTNHTPAFQGKNFFYNTGILCLSIILVKSGLRSIWKSNRILVATAGLLITKCWREKLQK